MPDETYQQLSGMKIKNIEGLTPKDLQEEEERGGKFIYYCYTISLLFITLKKTSDVYLIKAGESSIRRGLIYTILTVLFGWWGFPHGPGQSIQAIRTNMNGGKNVTDEVMQTVAGYLIFQEVQQHKQQEPTFKA